MIERVLIFENYIFGGKFLNLYEASIMMRNLSATATAEQEFYVISDLLLPEPQDLIS